MRLTKELRATAYHEAGHTIISYVYKIRFRYVTIEPDKTSLGHLRTAHSWESRDIKALEYAEVTPAMRDRLEKYIIHRFAGAAAEQCYTGRRAHMSGTDQVSFAILLTLSGYTSNEADAYANWLWIRTQNLIDYHWPKVEAVAEALLIEKRLTSERVHTILDALVAQSPNGAVVYLAP